MIIHRKTDSPVPDDPDRPSGRTTKNGRPVLLRVHAMGEAPGAAAPGRIGADPVKPRTVPVTHAVPAPPAPPEDRSGRAVFPDWADREKRAFTSWPSSQSLHTETEEGEYVLTLPPTRYRFGAALRGGPPSRPPDLDLAGAGDNPARRAALVLRNIAAVTRAFAARYAGHAPAPAAASVSGPDPSPDTTRQED